MSNTDFENISFDLPKNQSNVIKVIGVGGGGSNAINHMFQAGIKGVDFVVCNTDAQALENSPVPIKIQLGVSLTEGLGAGANPEVGEKAAVESTEEVKQMLGVNTKMVFITAGMGGGTGTGAAPVIAKMSKEMDILTVGIVTIPFQFEGKTRNEQAQLGVEKLRSHVDSLIVINNNKLREVYGNLGFKAGFSKADEVLATASRGIAEVITHHYTQNIDLRDAKTVLSNSGTAIMGSANATGNTRATDAIRKALDSPLLNDNKITGSKNVLLLIVSGEDEITIDEIGEINDHIQDEAGYSANIIMGVGEDESLGEAISVTIIATGFNVEQQNEIVNTETKKIIHTLEDEQKAQHELSPKKTGGSIDFPKETEETREKIVKHTLDDEEDPMEIMMPTEKKREAPKQVEQAKAPEKPEQAESAKQAENTERPETPKQKSADFPSVPSAIRDLIVEYEEVIVEERLDYETTEEDEDDDDDFEIVSIDTPAQEEDTVDMFDDEEEQFTLSFDMPLNDDIKDQAKVDDEAEIVYDLEDDDFRNIDVKSPIEVISGSEAREEEEKRYSLDDYMDFEDHMNKAKPKQPSYQKEEEPVVFEKKTTTTRPEEANEEDEVKEEDPVNTPISQVLSERAAERRRKMKEFNYKFRNSNARIDEIEKQPAYKRMGLDLSNKPSNQSNISRTSLGSDEEGIKFRSNNSFLHDNVD